MADVAITFSILPEDSSMDLAVIEKELRAKLEGKCRISNLEQRDIAFGLKKLNLEVVVKDQEGEQDRVEETLRNIKGVGQVDAEDMSLV